GRGRSAQGRAQGWTRPRTDRLRRYRARRRRPTHRPDRAGRGPHGVGGSAPAKGGAGPAPLLRRADRRAGGRDPRDLRRNRQQRLVLREELAPPGHARPRSDLRPKWTARKKILNSVEELRATLALGCRADG